MAIQNAAMDGLQTVPDIGQCAPDDHAHGIVEVGLPHLVFEADGQNFTCNIQSFSTTQSRRLERRILTRKRARFTLCCSARVEEAWAHRRGGGAARIPIYCALIFQALFAQMPPKESVDLVIEARWVLPIAPVNTVLTDHAVAVTRRENRGRCCRLRK